MLILPSTIKQFLKLAPFLKLEMFDFKSYTKSLAATLKTLSDTDDYSSELLRLSYLESFGISISPKSLEFHNGAELFFQKNTAEKVLFLYFVQILNEKTVFLDLSQKHFTVSENNLLWRPSRLRHTFESTFIKGLKDVYKGFYSYDEVLFQSGLKHVGLTPDSLKDEQKKHIESLFLSHFSDSREKSILMKLNVFQKSFESLFEAMVNYKIKLNSEFAYLGIYLSTLYQSLDFCEVELDVKNCYLSALRFTENSNEDEETF